MARAGAACSAAARLRAIGIREDLFMVSLSSKGFEPLRQPVAAGGQVLLDGDPGAEQGTGGDDAAGQDDDLDAERSPGADQAAELVAAGVQRPAVDHDADI